MKTAMQQLIDELQKELDSFPDVLYANGITNALIAAESFLHAEKNQILKARKDGLAVGLNIPKSWVSKKQNNKYYVRTFHP